ncbi:MAG: hypothetical protein Q4B48_01145 [Syntrophomonadaceae bacterium]|nr:hypothetical protein [Syntrophomonadaceae bacterium]
MAKRKHRKLWAVALSLVLLLGMSAAVHGATGSNATSGTFGTASTAVSLIEIGGGNLRATVPLAVTLAVTSASGEVIGPNNYSITNGSDFPIYVAAATATAASGYTFIVTPRSQPSNASGATLAITLTNGGNEWQFADAFTPSADYNLGIGGSKALTFSGYAWDLPRPTAADHAFDIQYTIRAGSYNPR